MPLFSDCNEKLEFVISDTFNVPMQLLSSVSENVSNPINLTGWIITCYVRDKFGKLIDEMEVNVYDQSISDNLGWLSINKSDTSNWYETSAYMDLKCIFNGNIRHTSKVNFEIIKPITIDD